MKGLTARIAAIVLLAAAGWICLQMARLDSDLAAAERQILSMEYDAPRATYERAERYFEYASLLPMVGNGPLNGVRARQAALRYWKREFETIMPEQTEPVAGVQPDNVALQFIVANAVYRDAAGKASDRPSTLQALNKSIGGYATVLRNAERHDDAAYNYELLVRVRDEMIKGRRAATPPEQELFGRKGQTEEGGDTTPFEIYVPYESDERGESSDAAKSPPRPRKG